MWFAAGEQTVHNRYPIRFHFDIQKPSERLIFLGCLCALFGGPAINVAPLMAAHDERGHDEPDGDQPHKEDPWS